MTDSCARIVSLCFVCAACAWHVAFEALHVSTVTGFYFVSRVVVVVVLLLVLAMRLCLLSAYEASRCCAKLPRTVEAGLF